MPVNGINMGTNLKPKDIEDLKKVDEILHDAVNIIIKMSTYHLPELSDIRTGLTNSVTKIQKLLNVNQSNPPGKIPAPGTDKSSGLDKTVNLHPNQRPGGSALSNVFKVNK